MRIVSIRLGVQAVGVKRLIHLGTLHWEETRLATPEVDQNCATNATESLLTVKSMSARAPSESSFIME